jgi:hypothetical protein
VSLVWSVLSDDLVIWSVIVKMMKDFLNCGDDVM